MASAARGVQLVAVALAAALPAPPSAAADEPVIPPSLREGWGFADDIRQLGESLAGGYELSERDVDCDGRPEVLLERLALRRATGNRGYLLFDHGQSGYRYLGTSGAIWAVLDFTPVGGCYLASYARGTGGRMTLRLDRVTRGDGGGLEPVGSLELLAGDAGADEDNALLSAVGSGGVEEERLLRLFSTSGLPPVERDPERPLPWVERSTVEEVVETVAGSAPRSYERVRPEEVGEAERSPWWGAVSPRVAREWAAAVAEAVTGGETPGERPYWLPPPGAGDIDIVAARVHDAVRLSLPLGRPPVGVATGWFAADLRRSGGAPPRRVEITWTAVLATTRLGEAEGVLHLLLGRGGDGAPRRVFRLERLTNLDYDQEQEVVIEEEADGGRWQWLFDFSRRGEVDARALHAGGAD